MILIIFVLLLCLLFILPFSAGLREIWKKTDANPLFINMEYTKDPRYFAHSFRKLFHDSMQNNVDAEGQFTLSLSKPETVDIRDNATLASGYVVDNIYYVHNDLTTQSNVLFKKEVYVRGNANIGAENQLRALASDKNIHLEKGTVFSRWIDAEGDINVEENCDLGISVSCNGKLSVASNCTFKRLYGFPVVSLPHVGSSAIDSSDPAKPVSAVDTALNEAAAAAAQINESEYYDAINGETKNLERNLNEIPPNVIKEGTIITEDSIRIGDNAVIIGDIKTHGSLVTGTGVTIRGNIFAEENIELGTGSHILGTAFCQGWISLSEGVTIGSQRSIKSVTCKKGIEVSGNVKVYGYLITEGEGTVI